MLFTHSRVVRGAALLLVVAALGACAFRGKQPAPVEDRGQTGPARPAPVAIGVPIAPDSAAITKPLPGVENSGKPGYYTVKPGDTVIRIGLETGQNWRDIVRWNALDNPNLIEVGQVLRVLPPGVQGGEAVAIAKPVLTPSITPNTTLTVPPSAPVDDDVAWILPTNGTVLAGFDEAKNKGIDFAGKLGDPVLAAGDGRVVYAGGGLRGYGNLIILKHNNTFLSAYAHNQTLLVKEDQTVRKGQKIAEMGATDADRVKLHFEIRRQGKPVDPARYLPVRASQ
ncbi:MAG: peptidoglycan DD-metalloendopeptidase family protein [Burkholderiaceae bacterium]